MSERDIVVGFTATQRGLTKAQNDVLHDMMMEAFGRVREAHHGDCIGGDQQIDAMLDLYNIDTVIHPPTINTKRAWCARHWAMRMKFGEMLGGKPPNRNKVTELPPRPYLTRNHDIVRVSRVLIAAPGEMTEQLRSGTWATVRYARKLGRTIRLIMPDGSKRIEPPLHSVTMASLREVS